jgi:hypothetical protein
MNRHAPTDLEVLANVFYENLSEDSTWNNPFAYEKWKPHMILEILGEEPQGEFSELHQDSLSEEQRQYAYTLYKTLPLFLKGAPVE